MLDRLRPVSVLHLHLAAERLTGQGPGVVRGEQIGAISIAQLQELVGTHRGPPGQTRRENLGPLGRHHHRAKTFGDFELYQPLPGLYLWRTPTGHWYRVDHRGTTPLGTEVPEILRQTEAAGSVIDTHFSDLIVDLAA